MQQGRKQSGRAIQRVIISIGAAATFAIGACGHKDNQQSAAGDVPYTSPATATTGAAPAAVTDTTMAPHHSKMAGALVGAAAGHMLGGHAVAGAAVGALVQHERNKHRP